MTDTPAKTKTKTIAPVRPMLAWTKRIDVLAAEVAPDGPLNLRLLNALVDAWAHGCERSKIAEAAGMEGKFGADHMLRRLKRLWERFHPGEPLPEFGSEAPDEKVHYLKRVANAAAAIDTTKLAITEAKARRYVAARHARENLGASFADLGLGYGLKTALSTSGQVYYQRDAGAYAKAIDAAIEAELGMGDELYDMDDLGDEVEV